MKRRKLAWGAHFIQAAVELSGKSWFAKHILPNQQQSATPNQIKQVSTPCKNGGWDKSLSSRKKASEINF
ncbi:hypothetical protein, partial [Lentilactobacillus parabuchneri]